MGKEKEMLKAILANTQLIMKHLNIEASAPTDIKEKAKAVKPEAKKPVKKPMASKPAKTGKK